MLTTGTTRSLQPGNILAIPVSIIILVIVAGPA